MQLGRWAEFEDPSRGVILQRSGTPGRCRMVKLHPETGTVLKGIEDPDTVFQGAAYEEVRPCWQ
jgi:hypothetical protein